MVLNTERRCELVIGHAPKHIIWGSLPFPSASRLSSEEPPWSSALSWDMLIRNSQTSGMVETLWLLRFASSFRFQKY